jgi:hypothetical protein
VRSPSPDAAVLIDSRSDAWVCFVLDGTSSDPAWERSSWQQFSLRIAERLASWIGPDRRTHALAKDLCATLCDAPGVPIGVTWDGGLAITASDYRAAERRLALARESGVDRPKWRGASAT